MQIYYAGAAQGMPPPPLSLRFGINWSIPWIFFTNEPVPETETLTKRDKIANALFQPFKALEFHKFPGDHALDPPSLRPLTFALTPSMIAVKLAADMKSQERLKASDIGLSFRLTNIYARSFGSPHSTVPTVPSHISIDSQIAQN